MDDQQRIDNNRTVGKWLLGVACCCLLGCVGTTILLAFTTTSDAVRIAVAGATAALGVPIGLIGRWGFGLLLTHHTPETITAVAGRVPKLPGR